MENNKKMPVLFVGHGTPMNAVEDNTFSQEWVKLGKRLEKPKAIVAVSAHWYTDGICVSSEQNPETIYDMYGFPKALYQMKYQAKNHMPTVERILELTNKKVSIDNSFGYDHGVWSVLCHMYPEADIPVVPLSVAKNLTVKEHYELGQTLSALRDENVLIIASGNIVHNLALLDFKMEGGHDFANDYDEYIYQNTLSKNYENLLNQETAPGRQKSYYTLEHLLPFFVVLGASTSEDEVTVFNKEVVTGAISMTSYLFEQK